eukprot:TRINITY_DN1316_c0_g1_i1.p1 TRINITY_DN1316_c0_g1~~TRINITY_DN1316_c0_g1_i1.p1  ORF type:complete len:441 (+),score=114.83 TRINITY_DN1316_c0_g1_i1:241-1563(+)
MEQYKFYRDIQSENEVLKEQLCREEEAIRRLRKSSEDAERNDASLVGLEEEVKSLREELFRKKREQTLSSLRKISNESLNAFERGLDETIEKLRLELKARETLRNGSLEMDMDDWLFYKKGLDTKFQFGVNSIDKITRDAEDLDKVSQNLVRRIGLNPQAASEIEGLTKKFQINLDMLRELDSKWKKESSKDLQEYNMMLYKALNGRIRYAMDAIEESLNYNIQSTASEGFQCPICSQDKDMDERAVLGCPHNVCHLCISAMVQNSLKNAALFPPHCPTCTNPILGEQGCFYLEGEDLTKFEQRWIEREGSWWHCPDNKCANPVEKEEGLVHVRCPAPGCKIEFCMSCNALWHEDLTCAQWIALPADMKSLEGRQNAEWLRTNTKACPYCGISTIKISGCNHMTCPTAGCGGHFCWVCGFGARTAREIYAHQRACRGPTA